MSARPQQCSSRREPPRRARDSGISLIEILVAAFLLGTVGVAVLGSFAASIRAASVSEQASGEQAWLSSAANLLTGPGTDYVHCDTGPTAAYQALLDERAAHGGWPPGAVTVTLVRQMSPGGEFGAGCQNNSQTRFVQRIDLLADNGSGGRTLQIVKTGPSLQIVETGP
jgi:type II secretory pathway pseudopilin PulG